MNWFAKYVCINFIVKGERKKLFTVLWLRKME